ncbi:hypothetical protein ACJMK2_000984 [Sinanodonta woodiana]|uniref:B box-type domain-containing protein n=1 Tax=Sinanodonta woodiana TaxID=1069815 RepID=A0ABD3XQW5_SINWO
MATASEDLTASDEIQETEATLSEDLNCPLCMKIFRSPRRLPLHTFCNAYQAQDVVSPAENVCTVCEEALCIQCSKMHGISRLLTNHTILKIEDLQSKQQTVLENTEMFRCTEHTSLPIEYYCKGHGTQLCIKCSVDDHASCPEVIKLANNTPDLSDALNQMKEQMKNLEDQLKQCAAINVLNLSKLESDVNNLTIEIRTLKKIINDALDDQEKRVKEEGNIIVNDEKKRTKQTTKIYQSHVTAILNSNVVLESASKYATKNQTFLLIRKITNHV